MTYENAIATVAVVVALLILLATVVTVALKIAWRFSDKVDKRLEKMETDLGRLTVDAAKVEVKMDHLETS